MKSRNIIIVSVAACLVLAGIAYWAGSSARARQDHQQIDTSEIDETEGLLPGIEQTENPGSNTETVNPADLKETQQREFTLQTGQEFTITLEENGSTGYMWSHEEDSKVIKLVNEKSTNTAASPNTVGAPVMKTWTFQALEAGSCLLTFSYARPWEKDTPPEKTVEFTVTVK